VVRPHLTFNALKVCATSQIAFYPKPLHQLLPDFHLEVRLQPTQQLFPLGRVHRGELAHHFLARFIFRVFAPADAKSEQTRGCPDRDISAGYHRRKIKDEG